MIVGYSGLTFFALGMMLSDISTTLPIFPFAGFAIFAVSMVYLFWRIRCPRCRHLLTPIMSYGSPLAISKEIKFCPFCGIDIDTELKKGNEV